MPSDQKQQAIWIHLIKSWITKCRGWPQLPRNVTWTRLGSPDSWMMVDDRQGGLVAQRLVRYQIHGCTKKNEWCGWPGMKTPLRPCRVLDHQDWKKKNVLHQEVCNTSKKKIVSLYCTHPTILQPPDFTPKALLILCQHQGDGRIRRNDASDPVALMLWTKRVVSDSFSPCLGFRKVLRMLLGLGGPQGAPGGPRMLEGHECCSLRLYLQPEKKPLVMRCHNQQGWWTSTFIPWILMKNFRGKPAKNVQEKNDPICGSKFLPIQSL